MLLAFLGQSVTNLCPFMGCLHALHFGGALDFFWLCATTSETIVTKRSILTASILGYLHISTLQRHSTKLFITRSYYRKESSAITHKLQNFQPITNIGITNN